jgi:hypothetical protein
MGTAITSKITALIVVEAKCVRQFSLAHMKNDIVAVTGNAWQHIGT